MLKLAGNKSFARGPLWAKFASANDRTGAEEARGFAASPPGVYLMKDRFGTVIYVGKARDLRKRVMTYFQPSRRMGWDLKFRALTDSIYKHDAHMVPAKMWHGCRKQAGGGASAQVQHSFVLPFFGVGA